MKFASRSDIRSMFRSIGSGIWSLVPADAPVTHILDIGANVGVFSIYARMRWPKAAILAVEPDAVAYGCLVENVYGFAIQTLNAALGAVGIAALTNPVRTSIHRMYLETQGEGVVSIPLHLLMERALAVPGLRLDKNMVMLKMDAQGGENYLLKEQYPEDVQSLRTTDIIGFEFHEPFREVASRWYLDKLRDTHEHKFQSVRNRPLAFVHSLLTKGMG
jgi:FkbM family methyltransferase